MSIVFVKPTVYELTLRDGDGVACGFSVKANSLSAAREFAIEGIALYAGELDHSTYEFSIRKNGVFDKTTSVLISQYEVDEAMLAQACPEIMKTPTIYMSLIDPDVRVSFLFSVAGHSFKEAREEILDKLAIYFDDFKTYVPRFHIEVYDLSKHVKKEFTISRLEVILRRNRLLKIKGGEQA